MASLPKICAVALVLAAGSSDGRIPLRQSGCSQCTSNRPTYGIHTPSSGLLMMNSLLRDPWFEHRDLWRDPFRWGYHFPWSLSHQPWGTGLSVLGPSLSAKRNEVYLAPSSRLGHLRCQGDAAEMDNPSLWDDGMHEQSDELECRQRQQEAYDKRKTQQREDEIQRERVQYQREKEQQQQMEQQRLKQERQKMLKGETDLKRRQEERRLHEERRRMQQRRQEEEAERRIQRLQEEEEQRLKERSRARQEQEAAERRIQREQEMRRKMQEQDSADARRQHETGRSHPHQGMNNNMRYRQGSSNQNHRQQFRKSQVAALKIPGYAPEDVSVATSGNRLVVQGKHVCNCHEKCTEREFQRNFEIPRNVDPTSLEAKLVEGGQLTISGNQYNNRVQPTEDFIVSVEGDSSFSPRPRNVDSTCGEKRSGFKLKKINKRTGEIVEDYEELVKETEMRTFEDEIDEDGVTMEVVD